ncbi:MAG: hypothetical protein AB8W37_01770 [Arsenophonus endosymbiont of Dermacentor nuttalli]
MDSRNAITLNDVTDQPLVSINNFNDDDSINIISCSWQYEDPSLPDYLLSVTEQGADGISHITERLIWGGNSKAKREQNLANQRIHHYDTAGLDQTIALP